MASKPTVNPRLDHRPVRRRSTARVLLTDPDGRVLLFADSDPMVHETTDDDELPRVQDDLIDLRPLVVDELTLAMPMVPLCSDDCLGLCSECGVRLADAEPGHSHEILDPRWAALAEKFGTEGNAAEQQPHRSDRDSDPSRTHPE